MTFDSFYSLDEWSIQDNSVGLGYLPIKGAAEEFLRLHAGKSYNNGIYRIFRCDQMVLWSQSLAGFSTKKNILCFGYDWLGRIFAVDVSSQEKHESSTLMLEPGTGKTLEIPEGVIGFHNIELTKYYEEALAASFYGEWLKSVGKVPSQLECIGYKKPLFIGGVDTVENLELSDMEVYWSVCMQIYSKVKDLPPGTPIGNISIS